MQRHARGQHAAAAVRDVREGAAVNQGGRPFERLHQVGQQRVPQQDQHRAGGRERFGRHRLAVVGKRQQRALDALPEVIRARRQAQHRHHLGCRGDVEAGLARHAFLRAAEADDRVAERAVVHVEHAPPQDAPGVDAQRVAEVEVVVEQRRQQVVGRGDCVEVAGEVQVDAVGRDDLAVAAPGRAALHAHTRPQRRLAQRQADGLAQLRQGLGETDAGRGLALSGRRGRDGRDQHQSRLACARARPLEHREVHLGDPAPVEMQVLRRQPQAGGDLADGERRAGACDLDVAFHGRASLLFTILPEVPAECVRRSERLRIFTG
jgi:hypothetical protein